MKPFKVLVIIPAFNEGSVIFRLVREMKAKHPGVDLVVVNDGSIDNTTSEAERAGAAVAPLPYNLGIGGAVQTGFKIAFKEGYDVAVQLDGDAQHDPQYLPALLKPVLDGKLDLSIGSRFLSGKFGFKSTLIRRFGIRFFSWLLSRLSGVQLTDPTSGFRAVNRPLIELFAKDYPVDFPEPEAIQIAHRNGYRIGEVPVQMRKRLGGVSSIRYMATAYYMLKVTLAILIDTMKKKNKGTT